MGDLDSILTQSEFTVRYLLDGVDLRTLYIRVSGITGLFDFPERRMTTIYDSKQVTGKQVDLQTFATEPRTIRMECVVADDSANAVNSALQSLYALIDTTGLHQLTIEYDGASVEAKALSYLVYREQPIKVSNTLRSERNVWTFIMTLQEPLTSKYIYRYNPDDFPADGSITIDVTNPVQIGWGDGTITLADEDDTYTHEYESDDAHVVAIAFASEDDCTITSTNLNEIWTM